MGPCGRQGRWVGEGVDGATEIPWRNPEARADVLFRDDSW